MRKQPAPHRCTIVPPYLLEALASSDDPAVAAWARATLTADEDLRRTRRSAELRSGAAPRASTVPKPRRSTTEGPQRAVHDAKSATTLPGDLVRGEGQPDTGDREVTEAYDGLGSTWELWQQVYGRNSLDGKGLPLVATVHYGTQYDNAFWDGTQMVFGDGDGVIFQPFTRSLDVIGHELAHGVTQYTSGLNYQDQSGALNESVSDVFGVLVKQRALGQSADQADWLIGAELLAPDVKGVALRSMAAPGTAYDDPRLGKDPQPAHLDHYVDTTDDNGGVHINSGIPNKAFHVLATTLGGNAWEVAGQVWVDTITGDISADCDFATFAALTVAAATKRHGEESEVVTAVRAAWDAVGVTSAATAPDETDPSGTGNSGSGDDGSSSSALAPGTSVSVRRTGGFAGRTLERTVTLEELPTHDTRAWQSLLADDRLTALAREAAATRRMPDAFCYGVRCETPPLDVELPEPQLSDDVRSLLERTLAPGEH
ncbi:protealysin inhibitor emfourin [Oryzobacter telluris]|uniref:protealysin inhibitor emfourin n=1 Tax=Oryzobacter telluris TaxID=3149179 RepID=UPI00370D6D19